MCCTCAVTHCPARACPYPCLPLPKPLPRLVPLQSAANAGGRIVGKVQGNLEEVTSALAEWADSLVGGPVSGGTMMLASPCVPSWSLLRQPGAAAVV